jgi:hypothetical protein
MKNPDNKKLTLIYQDKAKYKPEQGIVFLFFDSFHVKRSFENFRENNDYFSLV